MNKKQFLLLLTLIFGVQTIRPISKEVQNEIGISIARFIGDSLGNATRILFWDNPDVSENTKRTVAITLLAPIVGYGAIETYKYAKDKINRKIESWARQSDQELLQEMEMHMHLIRSQFNELSIYNSEKMWYELGVADRAFIVSELADFYIKNRENGISQSAYINRKLHTFNYHIERLEKRKNERFLSLQKSMDLENFNILIDRMKKVSNQLLSISALIKTYFNGSNQIHSSNVDEQHLFEMRNRMEIHLKFWNNLRDQ